MGHYAPECKKPKKSKDSGKSLISNRTWVDSSNSDEVPNYSLIATADAEPDDKVLVTTYAYDTDDSSELRRYCINLHKNLNNRSLECEIVRSEFS